MADTQNKRKFDDPGSAAGVSYNRVPPPLSDFESAKQRALQIAARLTAQETKRSRFDDRTSDDSNAQELGGTNEASAHYSGQLSHSKSQEKAFSEPASTNLYGLQGAPESKKVEIPNIKVGLVIGKGGETIKYIQQQSGARIQITRDMDHNPNLPYRMVELMGTSEQINRAEQLIHDVIAEADAAATNPGHLTGVEQIQMNVPTNKVGLIIGRGGETIKNLQSRTGARIQLVPLLGPPEYHSGVTERTLTLVGNKEQIDTASDLIKELISENRIRGPSVQGSYNQPYNSQVSQQWPPPGPPMQQQGYGYQQGYQQGSYYPAPPPSYGSYPQQTWNQVPAVPAPQFHPQGGYGYYNQQGQIGFAQQGQGYDQSSYADQPPGTSQEGYGQHEAYGQIDSHQGYGPPGASSYGHQSYAHGVPQEGYGPPGVGEPGYGQSASKQEQSGAGQAIYGSQEGKDQGEQPYENLGHEIPNQNFEHNYDRKNESRSDSHEPSHSLYGHVPDCSQGEYMSGQMNYGKPDMSWNHGSTQYAYSHTNYEQAGQQQSGYEHAHPQHNELSDVQHGYSGCARHEESVTGPYNNGCVNAEEPSFSNDRRSYDQDTSEYKYTSESRQSSGAKQAQSDANKGL